MPSSGVLLSQHFGMDGLRWNARSCLGWCSKQILDDRSSETPRSGRCPLCYQTAETLSDMLTECMPICKTGLAWGPLALVAVGHWSAVRQDLQLLVWASCNTRRGRHPERCTITQHPDYVVSWETTVVLNDALLPNCNEQLNRSWWRWSSGSWLERRFHVYSSFLFFVCPWFCVD